MVLVIDVGNTNITFGVYDRKNLVTTFRLMAKTQRTSDEYGVHNHCKRRAKRYARAHWRHQALCV